MAGSKIVVGLEVGTFETRAAVCELEDDGETTILGVGQTASYGVKKGEIVDFGLAGACIKGALADAEEKADVEIRSVYLAVSGGHVCGLNNRGGILLPEEHEEINETDRENVAISARDVNIPPQDIILHSLLQSYSVDGQEGVLNPIGMLGHTLEADFHIIHAAGSRVKTAIRCAKEIGIEVEEVVFSGFAAAQMLLGEQQKDLGALVIDIGGGTTDFIVYRDGAIRHSGVIAVGGDHITGDISKGFGISMAQAELLKVEEGNAMIEAHPPEESPVFKGGQDDGGGGIKQATLHTIIHLRVREIFELIRHRLEQDGSFSLIGAGVFLTGGTSLLKGIHLLAMDVFETRVHKTPYPENSLQGNPRLSVVLGLARYADAARPPAPPPGLFGRVFRALGAVFRQ